MVVVWRSGVVVLVLVLVVAVTAAVLFKRV
jgi:hypothetical protein